MELRPEEQLAAEQFAAWLGEKFGMRVLWVPVSPDPPDLHFTVELERP
jgi:hypothetical protein